MLLLLDNQVLLVRYKAGMVIGDLLCVLDERRIEYNPRTTTFYVNGNRVGRSQIWDTPVDHLALIEIKRESVEAIIGNVSKLLAVNHCYNDIYFPR